jgi:hypothetical protein
MMPRPKPPVQISLLVALVCSGLIALWLAAYHAFQNVVSHSLQAVFAATLIEAGLVVDAMVAVKYDSLYAKIGLIIAIIVSATYNFVQASQVAAGRLDLWSLLTLALGPLSALVCVALALGDLVTQYQDDIAAWDAAIAEAKRKEAEAIAEEERKQAEEERNYQRKQAELARKRAERAERERKQAESTPEPAGTLPEGNGNAPEVAGTLPEGLPVVPESPEELRKLAESGAVDLETLTGSMLAPLIGYSERTARKWIESAKNGDQ